MDLLVIGFIGVVVIALLAWFLGSYDAKAAKQIALLTELVEQGKYTHELLDEIKDSKSGKSPGMGVLFASLLGDPAAPVKPFSFTDDDDDDWDDDEDDDWGIDEEDEKPDPFGQDPDWWKKT